MKIFILAPHPDDEVLGCGGTIARYARIGAKIHLCIATRAYTPEWTNVFIKKRAQEIKRASKILGITKTHFLNWPTVKLDTIPQKEINDRLTDLLDQIQPDMLFIPHGGDLNNDHRLLFAATLVANRPPRRIPLIASYETLSETEWGQTLSPFLPNLYCDIASTLKKKIAAMKAYRSELKQPPHPRSLPIIEALAKKRGSESGCLAAEAFMVIKQIL